MKSCSVLGRCTLNLRDDWVLVLLFGVLVFGLILVVVVVGGGGGGGGVVWAWALV